MSYSRLSKKRKSTARTGINALRDLTQTIRMPHIRTGLEDYSELPEEDLSAIDDTVEKVKQELTESVPNEIETIYTQDGEKTETSPEATDAQVDTVIDVARLATDEAALESWLAADFTVAADKYDIFGHNGADILGARVGNEQFVEQELKAASEVSMYFNVRGQRQGRLAEMFFRTTVLPAEAPYAKFELYAPQIVRDRTRVINKVSAHNYTRLLDAAIDETLLNRFSTSAVPVHQTVGASTADFFQAGHPTWTSTIGDDEFETAPLATGKQFNLINLSARPGLVAAGVLDNTDTLEASVRLTHLVGSLDVGGSTKFVHFNVENLPSMQFIGADNSVGDEVIFGHNGRFAVINKDTLSYDESPAFAALNPTYPGDVILSASVGGSVNLNTGEGGVNPSGPAVVVGYIAPGSDSIDTDPTTLAAISNLIGPITLGGVIIKAARTNLNKRHEGILLAPLPVREAYRVELSEPLFSQLPIGVSNQERAQEIASTILVAGSRLRNNNLAITKLMATAASMESQGALASVTDVVMECEGISRYVIRPVYLKKTIDFDDGTVVSSLKSHERAADVSAAITNQIRVMSTMMWVRSNLESAFQFAADQGNLVKPKLAIGTDPMISQHLIVTGDTRLVGVRFDYELAFDMDRRIRDQIFLAFVSDDHQYLTFGQHLWVTELVTNLPLARAGRTVREIQVQPRNRHIITLPVLGHIVCQNLEKALLDPTIPTIPVEGLNP